MISPVPSSSCANWLITKAVICNQYYLLGIYFTKGKYLCPHLKKGHIVLIRSRTCNTGLSGSLGIDARLCFFCSGRFEGENTGRC
jgi:hypothetical protein